VAVPESVEKFSPITQAFQHCDDGGDLFGFVVLNPTRVAPEVLLTYLRLPIICQLMDLHTSASLYPTISERDLLKLPIPKIPDNAAAQITAQVRQAHVARQQAQALLAKAKRAVEIAIEEGEDKGMALLKE
jgi:hypothetical protein